MDTIGNLFKYLPCYFGLISSRNRPKRDKLVEFDWFSTVEGADCVIINWYVHYLHRPLMDVSEMEINNLAPKGLGGCLIFRHLN